MRGEYHQAMRLGLLLAVVLALGVFGGAFLGGCGSATTTVSVPGPPAASQPTSTAAPAPTTSTASTTTTTAPAQTTTSGGAPAPSATRTAPEPAFTQHGSSGTEAEGLSGATGVLRAKGFTPNNTSDYHPDQTLRVLLGTRTGFGQQAFFFVNGRYIGTDSTEPSATLRVVGQSDTEVTLAYPLYRRGEPTGGQALVHFQLNNGKLVPLNPIPPASSASGLSRQ